jgi:hypothetical protein
MQIWIVDLVFADGKDFLSVYDHYREAVDYATEAEQKLQANAHVWNIWQRDDKQRRRDKP